MVVFNVLNATFLDRLSSYSGGMHYSEIITDAAGHTITKMLFSPRHKPVVEVWDYLEYVRSGRANKYNTMKRVCEDLAYLYDFLYVVGVPLENINRPMFSDFIQYLIALSPNPSREFRRQLLQGQYPHLVPHTPYLPVERSMWAGVPLVAAYQSTNTNRERGRVVPIAPGLGLDTASILRIATRAVNYIEWLQERSDYMRRFAKIRVKDLYEQRKVRDQVRQGARGKGRKYSSKSVAGFLANRGLAMNTGIQPVDRRRIAQKAEIDALEKQAAGHPRDLFLLWLLRTKGFRIGEVLHLQMASIGTGGRVHPGPPPYQHRGASRWNWQQLVQKFCASTGGNGTVTKIFNDIYKDRDGIWLFEVRVSKTGYRQVSMEPYNAEQFETLLTNYLKWRQQKMKRFAVEDHGYLFVGRTGQPLTYWAARNRFRRYKALANLTHLVEVSLHSLRHFFIDSGYRETGNIDIVAEEAGNSPEVAKKMYTHRSPAEIAKYKDEVRQRISKEGKDSGAPN